MSLFLRNKSIIEKNPRSLIGRSKSEIITWLGESNNAISSNTWKYVLEQKYVIFERVIMINFNNNLVDSISLKTVLKRPNILFKLNIFYC